MTIDNPSRDYTPPQVRAARASSSPTQRALSRAASFFCIAGIAPAGACPRVQRHGGQQRCSERGVSRFRLSKRCPVSRVPPPAVHHPAVHRPWSAHACSSQRRAHPAVRLTAGDSTGGGGMQQEAAQEGSCSSKRRCQRCSGRSFAQTFSLTNEQQGPRPARARCAAPLSAVWQPPDWQPVSSPLCIWLLLRLQVMRVRAGANKWGSGGGGQQGCAPRAPAGLRSRAGLRLRALCCKSACVGWLVLPAAGCCVYRVGTMSSIFRISRAASVASASADVVTCAGRQ